tara:strand:+ start:4217 stop:4396 length:180 start_codon:yes stop_codon:yes gene_type:complete
MEAWLLVTAVIFTFVGYRMGSESGMHKGIDGTLLMLSQQKYIKITELPNGEISIDKAGE